MNLRDDPIASHPNLDDLPLAFVVSRRSNTDHPDFEVWTIRCPWCGHLHEHSGGPGHRHSHCGDRHPGNDGYVIVAPGSEPSGLDSYRRNRMSTGEAS